MAWEDCGIQLTHRSPDGHWYDPAWVADIEEQFGSDDEIKMVLDGSGNAHLVWEAEPTKQYDIHHAVVYLPRGTTQVWERDLPINTASSQPINETVGVLPVVPGKYYLSGVLTNPLLQTMATDSFPFYVFPSGIELTLESDKSIYRPDETIMVTGHLTNTGDTTTTTDILVTWETASETDNLGFNLWRGTTPAAPTEQLNDELILSQSPGGGQGAMYEWLDEEVATGTTHHYWLDAMNMGGSTTRFGPVSATVTAPTVVTLTGFDAAPMPLIEWWFVGIFIGLFIAGLKRHPPFRWR